MVCVLSRLLPINMCGVYEHLRFTDKETEAQKLKHLSKVVSPSLLFGPV